MLILTSVGYLSVLGVLIVVKRYHDHGSSYSFRNVAIIIEVESMPAWGRHGAGGAEMLI